MLAAVFIAAKDWLWPVIAVLVVLAAGVIWNYWRAPARTGIRTACAFLKIVGLLALAACLLEPLWTGQRARPGANFFLLVADNSQGMQVKDNGVQLTRGELLRDLLTAESSWARTLDEHFQVRRYSFDSRLQNTDNFAELAFDGRATSLGSALRTIRERYQKQPLAGVLLFSDGNATDPDRLKAELQTNPRQVPVYAVVSGRDEAIKDIAVNNVSVSQTVFEDAPVTVQADVTAGHYSGQQIEAQLLSMPSPAASTSAPSKVVVEQTQKARGDAEPLSFRFQVRPEQSGITYYQLRVNAKAAAGTTIPQEATLTNNNRVVVVNRGQGPYRILYVAGRPNWEYKFLRRALEEDSQIDLVALIRIAKREPKFDFRGRAGESSNPLFRGFGNQSKEDVERYDQPVLVRLNTRDELELRGGFPKVPEDLYGFQAVIIDDLEAEFFTADQKAMLQRFVSERGGGFLMLGGAESFHKGNYYRTPIGDMLPVYLDQPLEPRPSGEWRLSLTREGWLQPWARLRSTELEEKTRLAAMPPFQVLNRVRGIKPGASEIASVSDSRGNSYPGLVTHRFGHGRVTALMIGDMWRWGLHDETTRRDLDKGWRQLIRWLIADVPRQVELLAQGDTSGDQTDGAVTLQVRARDKKFEPLDNATVTLNIRHIAGTASTNRSALQLTAEASSSEAGVYTVSYVPREPGGYHAEAVVIDSAGMEVGRAVTGWTSDPAADEFRSLKPNRALLENIASATGGEIIRADNLDNFANSLPRRKAPITESWSYPIWHQPLVLLFALACLAGEWGLRRWNGLA